ncbi:hypothetical protein DEJ48_23680 [Streptomyces venezuelae]|uniref:Uncharacterized protein n=1 Tax=Streptomyces venezuelae TaxID=54571 RepID=A0A5P2C3Z4_STRVZ|nr:hypothetical protein DEJ48_23680 [Streptomyces venezuelae]
MIVAPTPTCSLGVHFVSVEIGLLTLMLYASGVSVTSPAAVSFSLPFMSERIMGLFFLMGGFLRSPCIFRSPV